MEDIVYNTDSSESTEVRKRGRPQIPIDDEIVQMVRNLKNLGLSHLKIYRHLKSLNYNITEYRVKKISKGL